MQRVRATGGDLHVVFVTDGENNPWPQRFIDRKLFIEAGDRARWGAMRRREALCSLARLGIGERSAIFLGFPDQGIAKLARRGDMRLRDELKSIVQKIQPTLLVTPSSFDLHPDHRAISRYAHMAAPEMPVATYVVHGGGPAERLAFRVELTEAEQRRKHEAIECHASQLALSRERFVAYARRTECFFKAEFDVARVESPLRAWLSGFRHGVRALLGISPSVDSGVQPAADVHDGAHSTP